MGEGVFGGDAVSVVDHEHFGEQVEGDIGGIGIIGRGLELVPRFALASTGILQAYLPSWSKTTPDTFSPSLSM